MQGTQFEPMTLEMLFWCVLVGAIIGVIFDLVSGFGRSVRRSALFVLDVLCGPVFAVITFFASLVITDGILSPMLFAGMLFGFLAEHFLVGKWLSKGVALLCRAIRKALRILGKTLRRGYRYIKKSTVFHKKASFDKNFFKKRPSFFKKRLEKYAMTK